MLYRLIRTDLKRITHYGTYMLIAASILMTILFGLAFSASSILYSGNQRKPLSIGIVMSADSRMAKMAYNTIENMDSYKASCNFTEIPDKDSALSMLKNGSLFAVIYVPDNIISDIMDGTNTPVEVYYSDMKSIDTFVLNDLFRSTSSMLGISQAAIYSVQAIGRDMNLSDEAENTLSDDINAMFLSRVLDRASMFTVSEINAVRASNTTTFYSCAAVILIMLLCSSVFIPFIIDIPASYKTRLRSCHMGIACQTISRSISIFVWEYLLYLSSCIILSLLSVFTPKLNVHLSTYGILYGLIVAAVISLFVIVICLVPAGMNGCTILLAVTSLAAAYLSGFFIPETMLPDFAKDLCRSSLLNGFVHDMCNYLS